MSETYIPAGLRRLVIERANGQCEYCRLPAAVSFYPYEVDHIIAEKHDGATEAGNLAYTCARCNRFKGTDLGSFDPQTREFTFLFNPRMQLWEEHYDLIETKESAWPMLQEWFRHSTNPVEVLPASDPHRADALAARQVTTRSPMGAIIYETGGLLIDHGWIRILGSGSVRGNRTLPEWNHGRTVAVIGDYHSC